MAQIPDRREQERIAVSADSSCSFVSPVIEDFGPARIKDISMKGIGLTLTRKVEPGVTLAVTLTNAAKSFTKTVLVRVVHVAAQPGGALIGGTFTVPLSYQEFASLVM